MKYFLLLFIASSMSLFSLTASNADVDSAPSEDTITNKDAPFLQPETIDILKECLDIAISNPEIIEETDLSDVLVPQDSSSPLTDEETTTLLASGASSALPNSESSGIQDIITRVSNSWAESEAQGLVPATKKDEDGEVEAAWHAQRAALVWKELASKADPSRKKYFEEAAIAASKAENFWEKAIKGRIAKRLASVQKDSCDPLGQLINQQQYEESTNPLKQEYRRDLQTRALLVQEKSYKKILSDYSQLTNSDREKFVAQRNKIVEAEAKLEQCYKNYDLAHATHEHIQSAIQSITVPLEEIQETSAESSKNDSVIVSRIVDLKLNNNSFKDEFQQAMNCLAALNHMRSDLSQKQRDALKAANELFRETVNESKMTIFTIEYFHTLNDVKKILKEAAKQFSNLYKIASNVIEGAASPGTAARSVVTSFTQAPSPPKDSSSQTPLGFIAEYTATLKKLPLLSKAIVEDMDATLEALKIKVITQKIEHSALETIAQKKEPSFQRIREKRANAKGIEAIKLPFGKAAWITRVKASLQEYQNAQTAYASDQATLSEQRHELEAQLLAWKEVFQNEHEETVKSEVNRFLEKVKSHSVDVDQLEVSEHNQERYDQIVANTGSGKDWLKGAVTSFSLYLKTQEAASDAAYKLEQHLLMAVKDWGILINWNKSEAKTKTSLSEWKAEYLLLKGLAEKNSKGRDSLQNNVNQVDLNTQSYLLQQPAISAVVAAMNHAAEQACVVAKANQSVAENSIHPKKALFLKASAAWSESAKASEAIRTSFRELVLSSFPVQKSAPLSLPPIVESTTSASNACTVWEDVARFVEGLSVTTSSTKQIAAKNSHDAEKIKPIWESVLASIRKKFNAEFKSSD